MANPLTSRRAMLTGIAAAAGGTLIASSTTASPASPTAAQDIHGIDAAAARVRDANTNLDGISLKLSEARERADDEIAALPHTTATYAGREGPVTISTADGTSFANVLAESSNRHADYARAGRRIVNAAVKREREAAQIRQRHGISALLADVRGAEEALESAVNDVAAYPVKTTEGLLHKLTVMISEEFQIFGDDPYDTNVVDDLRRILGREA